MLIPEILVRCPSSRKTKFGLEFSLALGCQDWLLLPFLFPSLIFPVPGSVHFTLVVALRVLGGCCCPASSPGIPQHQSELSMETVEEAAASVAPGVSSGSRLGLLPCVADRQSCVVLAGSQGGGGFVAGKEGLPCLRSISIREE